MFPDSTNSSENCKLNSSMEKPNGGTELQEGNSNVFNVPSFPNVSEQHFNPIPIPIEDVSYNECGKCKALQLELDRKEKISSCLKQKLCDFNHIMKSNKCKEEMCKELTVANQNLEKMKSELQSKNMELESMCLNLENKLSESLQDKLKVQQSVDAMNSHMETCKKDREEFELKNEQLEKELIQYKTLTVQRMTVEEDLATLQKNVIKKDKKLMKLQEQLEKNTVFLCDKEMEIKKIKTSFKTLLKVLVKFGTKLESGKSANKKDKRLLQIYVEKLNNFSNDDDTVWNDSMDEFSQSDLENSPQKRVTPMYSNNSMTNDDHQKREDGIPLFNRTPSVDFADRKENAPIFQNHSSASPSNNFNENLSTLPAEDSVFPSNNQIKTDPETLCLFRKNLYDSMQPDIHSNVNIHSQRNDEISTNSVGNSNADFKKTSQSSVNDNFGLPTFSNGRINVSQNYLFKGYLKQPFAECQSNGDLPACDDGLDITIRDLDSLKEQICMTKEQFAPLSPLPPTPPPNSQKKTRINSGIKKSLNMNEDQLHPRTSSDILSVPESSYSSSISSFVNSNNMAFDSSVGRDIPGFNSSPPQFYSGKKPSLCHQQSEGFEVQKDAAELQPDRLSNSQDTSYLNQCHSSVSSQDKVPHRVSAKRCHDGSIKLDMNFQNNNFGATDFEVDVENGRISFVFCPSKSETVKITPSTFSPVVIKNSPTPVSSVQKVEAFNTCDSVESKAPGFVGSKVSSEMCHASSQNKNANKLDVSKEKSTSSSVIGYGHHSIPISSKNMHKREHKQNATNLSAMHLSAAGNRENSSSPKSIVSSSGETPLASKKSFIQRPNKIQNISLTHHKQTESRKFKKPKLIDGNDLLASPRNVQELIDGKRFQDCNITITPIASDNEVSKTDKMETDNCIPKSPDKASMEASMPAPKSNLVQKRCSTLRKSNMKKFLSVSFVKPEEVENMEDVSFSKKESKQETLNNEKFAAATDNQYQLALNKASLMSENKPEPSVKSFLKNTRENALSVKNKTELGLVSHKKISSEEAELQLDDIHKNNLLSLEIESPQSPLSIKDGGCGAKNGFGLTETLNNDMPPKKVMKVTNIKSVDNEQLTNDENLNYLASPVVESTLCPDVETKNESGVVENGLGQHDILNQDIIHPKKINVDMFKGARTEQLKGVGKLNNSRCKLSLRSSHKNILEPNEVLQETEVERKDFNKSDIPQVIESPSSPMEENGVIGEHEKGHLIKDDFDLSELNQDISTKKIGRRAKTKQIKKTKKFKKSDVNEVRENDLSNSIIVPLVVESPLSPVAENEVGSESEIVTTDQKHLFQGELIQQSQFNQNLSPPKMQKVPNIKLRKTKHLKSTEKMKNSISKHSLRSCDDTVNETKEVQESYLNESSVVHQEIESPLDSMAANNISENDKVITEQKNIFQDDLCQQSNLTQVISAKNVMKTKNIKLSQTKQLQGSKLNYSKCKLLLRSSNEHFPKTNEISEVSDVTKVQENDLNKNSVLQESYSPSSPMAENGVIDENEKVSTDQNDLLQDFAVSKENSGTVLEQSFADESHKTAEQSNSLLTVNISTHTGDNLQDTQVMDESTNNDKSDKLISKHNMCDIIMAGNEEQITNQIVNGKNAPGDDKETVSNSYEHYFLNKVNDDSSGEDMLVIAEDNSEPVNDNSSANDISEKNIKTESSNKSRRNRKKKKGKKIVKTPPKIIEEPKSAIVTALEVLDNLRFNDLHYKQYTHSLLCAILNPSNAGSSDEAVLHILTHLASSKRNPMIPYMVSKDPSELLPLIESCIVSCLFDVDSKKKPHLIGLLKTTVTALYSSILTKKMVTVYGLASLCRVLCCMCKKMEDRKTPFNLCCGLLKISHNLAPYLIASIAGVWPEVLTQQEFGQDSLLMKVITYAIFKKPKQMTETLWKQCTGVLNNVCNISKPASLNTIEIANEIFDDIQAKDFGEDYIEEEAKCFTPLVILTVTEGWEWFKNNFLHTCFKSIVTELMHTNEQESQNRLNLFCNMFVDISFCTERENNEAQVFWTAITSEIFTNGSDLKFSVQESLICALMRLYIMKDISLTKTLTDWLSEHQKSICEHKIALVYKSHHWKNSSDANFFRIEDFNLDKIT